MKKLSRKFRRSSSKGEPANSRNSLKSEHNAYYNGASSSEVQCSRSVESSNQETANPNIERAALTRARANDNVYDECNSVSTAIRQNPIQTMPDHLYSDCNSITTSKCLVTPYNKSNNCNENGRLNCHNPMLHELKKLAKQGWYWGPMTREQAEERLCDAPDASFLVRDSSDDRYLLSLSFRSNNRTLHTRIEHSGMRFSFYEDQILQSYASIIELIENSIKDSEEQGAFCFSRSRYAGSQSFPVRLMYPVSRFSEMRSLQDLCRFVIRQNTRIDHVHDLPVPRRLKTFLEQSYF